MNNYCMPTQNEEYKLAFQKCVLWADILNSDSLYFTVNAVTLYCRNKMNKITCYYC